MEKHFCNYNQSLVLKELGYDEPCMGKYDTKQGDEWLLNIKSYFYYDQFSDKNKACIAPLKSQVFEWLYQKLGIEKGVMPLDIESQEVLLEELIDKVSSKHLLV